MDYIKQLNAFYSQMEYCEPYSASAIALYMALLHIANRSGWQEHFTVANKTLEFKSGLELRSLQRARNELVQKGVVVYKPGTNKRLAAAYYLPTLYDAVNGMVKSLPTQYDAVSGMVDGMVSGRVSGNIIKLKQNENENENVKHEHTVPDASREADVRAVVDHLNQRLGTGYKPTSKATVSHINARLKEGFTLSDFIAVIDKKALEWENQPNMAQYLRPQTLFGSKFESYLNQPWTDGRKANPTDIALRNFINMDIPPPDETGLLGCESGDGDLH